MGKNTSKKDKLKDMIIERLLEDGYQTDEANRIWEFLEGYRELLTEDELMNMAIELTYLKVDLENLHVEKMADTCPTCGSEVEIVDERQDGYGMIIRSWKCNKCGAEGHADLYPGVPELIENHLDK